MNLLTGLGIIVATIGGIGFITFQNTQIDGLKAEKALHLEEIKRLGAEVTLAGNERIRLDYEIGKYRAKVTEIELRYINSPRTIYRDVINTLPGNVISEKANEETNALFNHINDVAINFSLRNGENNLQATIPTE